MDGRCPDTFHCDNSTYGYNTIKPSLFLIPAYANLVSSFLSLPGATLILIAYCAFKDVRKGTAQTIISLLALADLGTAVGGLLGAALFIVYDNIAQKTDNDCYIFQTVCQIQGFMVLLTYTCSFIWTAVLAIHFLLVIAFNHATWIDKMMPFYNIVAWMVPLALALPLLIQDKLGYDPYLQYTCFMRLTGKPSLIFGVWWIIELISSILIFLGYTFTLICIVCRQTSRLHSVQRVNRRMIVIVVAYLILRIPDVLQLRGFFDSKKACLDDDEQLYSFVTTTIQAFTDTSQGWINCILYIFLSPELRKRMFVLPFKNIANRCKRSKLNQQLRTSEIAPLLGNTQITPSTRQNAREKGDTYVSFSTEFPTSIQEVGTGLEHNAE